MPLTKSSIYYLASVPPLAFLAVPSVLRRRYPSSSYSVVGGVAKKRGGGVMSSSSHPPEAMGGVGVGGGSSDRRATTTTTAASAASAASSGVVVSSPPDLPSKSDLVFGRDDALFGCIERNQLSSKKPFGAFLDAGTGSHSLKWIASVVHGGALADAESEGSKERDYYDGLGMGRYTAVTADETMRRSVLETARKLKIEGSGDVVIGNWAAAEEDADDDDEGEEDDPSSSSSGVVRIEIEGRRSDAASARSAAQRPPPLPDGPHYDTILADYLVGAIDGFSPYFQDLLFPRLSRHLKPGGRMYVVGLNPIPDSMPDDDPADVFCRVTKLRDACILLAGHRCYREYPVDWIHRHLESAGLKVVETSRFPILYSHSTIVRQLNVARSKLPLFPSKGLASEMGKAIDELERESKRATERSVTGRLKLGFDYVVTAEKPY